MRALNYKLIDGEPVACGDDQASILDWARWFESFDRVVAQTNIGEVLISTVFLGIDHNFHEEGAPILFETMVFGGEYNEYQKRYRTLEEAMLRHEWVVGQVEARTLENE